MAGASVGGVAALSTLVGDLPGDFPAPVLVVLHTGSHPSLLPELLSARGPLPAAHAIDGESLSPGRIYIAPPDMHMLIDGEIVRLHRGPKEHHTRPAIDPLFLSAALAHGPCVIGVVLSGTMEDGTAGLQAIKACGGTAVVQEPADAMAPGMPESALRYVAVDHRLPVAALGELLVTFVQAAVPDRNPGPPPQHLVHEMKLMSGEGDFVEHLSAIAQPSPFVCPDCKGGLWQIDQTAPTRYRCHTGHAYTLSTLQQALTETMDEALWTAVRALQEQTVLLAMLGVAHRREGNEREADRLDGVRKGLEIQCRRLREIVESPLSAPREIEV
ncbi:chemotaxis protein CheB [Variovorax sp. UMC13]|uniref:chemotaxis protein CheB n=1 Tax=Variovorax sp. UMC13 TaxID=1862326 RepID=UPI00287B7FE7|nr:chemotaxis protein CheB [Variovorax sp. UMC13]